MKKQLFIFLIFLGTAVWSQPPKTVSGKVFSMPRKGNFSGFLGLNANAIFAIDYLQVNRKKQELNLRRFHRSDLQLVESKNLYRVINESFYNEPNEVFYQNDTIYLFSTLFGLKDKYNLVYLDLYDQYGAHLQGKVLDTLSIDEKFYIQESEERNGFLLATHDRYDNIFDQKITLKAIDRSSELIWENIISSPVSMQNLSIEEIRYSLDAPIYILCNYGFEMGKGDARENTDLLNNNYVIWAYDHNKMLMRELDLRIKNRWINGIQLAFDDNHELWVSGFMNETRNYTVNGVFTLKLDTAMQVIGSNFYKYKRSLFSKFVEPNNLDKYKELENILLRDCIVLDDGSFFLFGEHYYQYTERNYDPRTNITTTTENYNYNSILVAYFDANGHHLWSDRIPKFQHTINDNGYFSSFSIMRHDETVYLFFNDSERNNELEPDDYFNYHSLYNNRRFQISYVQVAPEGVRSRGALIDADNNFMLRAKQSFQIDDDYLYLYGEVGKSGRLFSIDLNQ